MADNDVTLYGTFTSDGSAKLLNLETKVSYIHTYNRTQQATTQTPGRVIEAWWFDNMAPGTAYAVSKEDGANTVTHEFLSTGGFTRVDQTDLTPTLVGTSISSINRTTSVVTTAAAHGRSVGDIVQPYSTTGMRQVAGMPFTVTAVGSSTTLTLGYLDASGFAANASAGFLLALPAENYWAPQIRYITGITTGTTTQVQMSVTSGYVVDQEVALRVPSGWGATQLDGITAQILSINSSTNTITLDYDSSSGVSAFAFPTDATAAAGVSYPLVIPSGVKPGGPSTVAYSNEAQDVMHLAAGADGPAGSSGDVIDWIAFKAMTEIE